MRQSFCPIFFDYLDIGLCVFGMSYPLDIGRKLGVHKAFRGRPGGLLNVLYTFNLGPVSSGYVY